MGFFHKIFHSDVFVILDTVQYSKNSFINRNKIKTPNGPLWVTVPVLTKGKFGQPILETMINPTELWATRIQKTLLANYKRADKFEEVYPKIEPILSNGWETIAQLNIALIELLLNELCYPGRVVRSSQLNVSGESSELLISICREVGADTYISGGGGSKYQEEHLFTESGITLIYDKFLQPIHKQLWGDFLPGLSVIDYLLNCGFTASVLM